MPHLASAILTCGLLLQVPLSAQDSPFTLDRTPPPSNADAAMLAKVTPAIVSVFPGSLAKSSEEDTEEEGGGESPMDRYFRPDKEKKADDPVISGVGSGVILSGSGLIITNHHVVTLASGSAADAIIVELTDRRRFPAKLIGSDRLTDLALLKIEATDLPFLPVADSGSLRVGDAVYAIGNPFRVGLTVTRGIVSALDRSGLNIGGASSFEGFIQTDAPINPGNSGGALTDSQGRLVGINTAIYSNGGGNLGIGFSVPSNLALAIAERLLKDGKIKRGFFGARSETLDQDKAKEAGITTISGAVLTDVEEGGPAAKAGWVDGDVITAIDGKPVVDRGAFRLMLSLYAPGAIARCQGFRDGKPVEHAVTLTEEAAAPGASSFQIGPLPGVSFSAVENGLRVESVESTSIARSKLKAGQILTTLNGEKVTGSQSLEAAIRRGVNTFKLLSDGAETTVTLRLE